MKKFLPILLLVIALFSSCTLEKRRYMKGFYFKKNKKVETSPNKIEQANNTSTTANNPVNQTTVTPANPTNQAFISRKKPNSIPAFCMYAGLEDGSCSFSLNLEKIFCFNPYFDCFVRTGLGFSDQEKSNLHKKYVLSGGIAGGFPMLKIGAEYGYSGFINGPHGNSFCSGFIRFIPKRKSIYLKMEICKTFGDTEKKSAGFAAGLGIAF
jgi:hypothetical protein